MRHILLFLTLLCTCGPAQMHAQFTIAAEGGIGYGTFNREPIITNPTTNPAVEERLRAVGGDALSLRLGYTPADKKFGYSLRLQYLSRGYQHIYVEHFDGIIAERDALTSEVRFLDILPALNYGVGRRVSLSGGPYYSVALSEKNTPDNLTGGRRLHRQDYGIHLNGRYSFGRFYVWAQYQHSLQPFNTSAFETTYPASQPVQNPSPVSIIMWGVGFQIIR